MEIHWRLHEGVEEEEWGAVDQVRVSIRERSAGDSALWSTLVTTAEPCLRVAVPDDTHRYWVSVNAETNDAYCWYSDAGWVEVEPGITPVERVLGIACA